MELWKSQREIIETVDAALPDPEQHGPVIRHHTRGQFTVYVPFHRNERPYLGSATVDLEPEETTPDPERWQAAAHQALAVEDSWYPLGVGDISGTAARTSTFEKQELSRWVEPFANTVHQCLAELPVLSLREHLRFERTLVQYRDSFGRELDEVRYTGLLEVMLVPAEAPDSHPLSAELRFSEFAPEVIAGFLRDQAKQALSLPKAVATVPTGEYEVLLRGAALVAVFDFLLDHLGAPAVAAGRSSLVVDHPLWTPAGGDRITLTALGELYNSPKPGTFDDEGVLLQPRTLLRDGVVRQLWSTRATAHWLGCPLTGRPRNFAVSPGTVQWEGLQGRRILEVHRLRWAEVDRTTGDFQVEVELADWHEGGNRTPVFGLTASGNLRQILTNARFSVDVGSWEHYEGPEFLVIPSALLRSNEYGMEG